MTTNHPIADLDSRRTNSLYLNAVFMGTLQSARLLMRLCSPFNIRGFVSFQNLHDYLENQTFLTLPDVVLLELDSEGHCFELVAKIKASPRLRSLIVVLIAPKTNNQWEFRALKLKVNDYFTLPLSIETLLDRLHFLLVFKQVKSDLLTLNEDLLISSKGSMSNISGVKPLLHRIFQRN